MAPRATGVRFFTLAGRDYFVGVAALLNSLRLTGHEEELVVLDPGLTQEQRALLAPHATVVRLSRAEAERTLLAKPLFHRHVERGVAVWIDADIVVTASLDPVVEQAETALCAYADEGPNAVERWFASWFVDFGLRAPLRRQLYVNGGFLAGSAERMRELGRRWEELCALIPLHRVFRRISDPFWAGDQDALNALLMSEVPADAVVLLPEGEMAYAETSRRAELDERTLAASADGRPVRLLHYAFYAKPWQRRGWVRADPRDAYQRALRRLLWEDDVVLRLDPRFAPPWLRPGVTGRLARPATYARAAVRRAAADTVHRLPDPARRRIVRARRRLAPRDREVE